MVVRSMRVPTLCSWPLGGQRCARLAFRCVHPYIHTVTYRMPGRAAALPIRTCNTPLYVNILVWTERHIQHRQQCTLGRAGALHVTFCVYP